MMGIRGLVKNRLKSVAKRVIDYVVEKDVQDVGVPPSQVPSQRTSSNKQSPMKETSVSEVDSGSHVMESENDKIVAEEIQTKDPSSEKETQEALEAVSPLTNQEMEETAATVVIKEDSQLNVSPKQDDIDEKDPREGIVLEKEENARPKESQIIPEHIVENNLSEPISAEEKKRQAAQKHLEKTKKGLVKKISESGGEMSLGDLHTFSEMRYLIGHKKFSDLMEDMIAEELVAFSYESGIISLAGKAGDILG